MARQILGCGAFPKNDDARDLLLRDAFRLWQNAWNLISDYEKAGIPVLGMNPRERQEFIDKWITHSGPPMKGDEIIKFITDGERSDRAIPKLQEWLKSGDAPWGWKTLDDLKAPCDKGRVEFSHYCYAQWNAARISGINAVKGRSGAGKATKDKGAS